jgi:hypothetical protein
MLAAAEPRETFSSSACDDNLAAAVSSCSGLQQGKDSTFWFFGHLDNHVPCSELSMCHPDLGEQAVGPRIRLVGAW